MLMISLLPKYFDKKERIFPKVLITISNEFNLSFRNIETIYYTC